MHLFSTVAEGLGKINVISDVTVDLYLRGPMLCTAGFSTRHPVSKYKMPDHYNSGMLRFRFHCFSQKER
jgi:hypothetical protein